MNIRKNIQTFMLLMMGMVAGCCFVGCSSEEPFDEAKESDDIESRPLVDITISANIGTTTRVAYNPNSDGGLDLAWDAKETLGVYITDGSSYKRAGSLTSTGAATSGKMQFSGKVSVLNGGEQYYYMYPDLGSTNGSTINYSSQSGTLGSTSHLKNLVPIVWQGPSNGSALTGDAGTGEVNGYVIHLTLSFAENPGTIQTIRIQTMNRDGADNVFASKFDPSSMSATELTNSLTLNVTGGSLSQVGSEYKAEAYIACSYKTIDVFRSKFNVEVTAQNGTYKCDYKSFPGQEANGITSLDMPLVNAKSYNMSRVMSKDAVPTIINGTYKVNSLLGMWNEYGKAYDPYGLTVYEGGSAEMPETGLPTQLKTNKSAICTKYKNNGDGTPTFLRSLYDSQNTQSDVAQANVSFNNITLSAQSEVYFTFISEYGWNQNLLGYYYYTGSAPTNPDALTKTIVFPNVSKPAHVPFAWDGTSTSGNTGSDKNIGTEDKAPLQEFETVKLVYTDSKGYSSTMFPAGTTIGFFMMIDTQANENSPKRGYDLLNWSQWRIFTNSSWNSLNSNWTGSYLHCNFFASGDVCNGDTPIPGLAIYGVKDKANDTEGESTAYGAMIFMVSTSVPSAMQTQNKAYFNLGTGNLVINK